MNLVRSWPFFHASPWPIKSVQLVSPVYCFAHSVRLFLQLEDDIVAKPNYFATMKNFALQLSSEDWMILEFSQLGFIGMIYEWPVLYDASTFL